MAKFFTTQTVAAALELTPEQLPDLAALCGNDITKQALLTCKLWAALGLAPKASEKPRGVFVAAVAKWLRHHPGALEDSPQVRSLNLKGF